MLLKTCVYSGWVHTGSRVIVAYSVLDSLAFLLFRGPYSPAASFFSYFSRCQYSQSIHTHT